MTSFCDSFVIDTSYSPEPVLKGLSGRELEWKLPPCDIRVLILSMGFENTRWREALLDLLSSALANERADGNLDSTGSAMVLRLGVLASSNNSTRLLVFDLKESRLS